MIYFDHNATTYVDAEIAKAFVDICSEYGVLNPNSVHKSGKKARTLLEKSRDSILDSLHAKCHKLVFTSGGTEGNNQVILGGKWDEIFISPIEHDSVFKPASLRNCKVLRVDQNGLIDCEYLKSELKKVRNSNFLVSIIAANNEIGVVQDVRKLADIVHKNGGVLHSDFTQFVGKEYVDLRKLDADIVTFSGHKIHCVHGIGAIVFKSEISKFIAPIFHGGGQEEFRRSGTQNVAGAACLSMAVMCANREDYIEKYRLHTRSLMNILEEQIEALGGKVIAKDVHRIHNTAMITMPNVESSVQMIEFDMNDICISNGAACSSGKVGESRVLCEIFGINENELVKNAIRVSIDISNTESEMGRFIQVWKNLRNRT